MTKKTRRPWMPLLVDDYLSSERVLAMDAHEERAYFRLFLFAWIGGGSVPGDERVLAEVSRSGGRWQKVRDRVMACFELREDGRWYHQKVYSLVAEADAFSESRRENGKHGGRPRNNLDESTRLSVANLDESCSEPRSKAKKSHTQSHTQTQEENNPPTPRKRGLVELPAWLPGFGAFWKLYPRKVAKRAAERAWRKLKPDAELLAKLLLAVGVQANSDQWQRDGGEFIPHPATWLNGSRWEDEGPVVAALANKQQTENKQVVLLRDARHTVQKWEQQPAERTRLLRVYRATLPVYAAALRDAGESYPTEWETGKAGSGRDAAVPIAGVTLSVAGPIATGEGNPATVMPQANLARFSGGAK